MCEKLEKTVRINYKKTKGNEIRMDSLKRTKEKIKDIAYANKFQYFVTFTLDGEKIDRYDNELILKRLKNWLRCQAKDFKYLIIPELHKDGAVHFHGLVSGWLKMKDSGLKTKNGQAIYNVGKWGLGFSTAVKLEGSYERIVNYIVKYITKDNAMIFGKSYFAGGRGLKREVPTRYENIDFNEVDAKVYNIPQAGMSVKYAEYDIGELKFKSFT